MSSCLTIPFVPILIPPTKKWTYMDLPKKLRVGRHQAEWSKNGWFSGSVLISGNGTSWCPLAMVVVRHLVVRRLQELQVGSSPSISNIFKYHNWTFPLLTLLNSMVVLWTFRHWWGEASSSASRRRGQAQQSCLACNQSRTTQLRGATSPQDFMGNIETKHAANANFERKGGFWELLVMFRWCFWRCLKMSKDV